MHRVALSIRPLSIFFGARFYRALLREEPDKRR